jgi:hypothetical protein
VADGLSKVLQDEASNRTIQGVKVSRRAPEITQLLFADDSLLFFRASEEQASTALDRYCIGTCQMINFDKCSILFNENQEQLVIEGVKEKLNIHRVAFEAKYLGLPTPEGRLKVEKFLNITDRLEKRCSAWDEQNLSSVGKDTLIKSVAQALPVYIMSIFVLLGKIQEALTRMIRRFWWGESVAKRKTQWITWDKFTTSKSKGGLGFRDVRLFNQALLAKQAWRLIERPNNLCARVLKAKYYPNGELLDMAFPTIQSPTWRAILHGLELLKQGVCWQIGRGSSVRIWRDPWIPRGRTRRPIGKRRPCRLKWVSQLIDESCMEWKEEVVREYFRAPDTQLILNIRLPSNPVDAFVSWFYEKNGLFSVRSAYKVAKDLMEEEKGGGQSSSRNQEGRPIWKKYWSLPLPHKILIFGWKVMKNGLASQSNKFSRHIVPVSTCEVCGTEGEYSCFNPV